MPKPVRVKWRDCFSGSHQWVLASDKSPEDPVIVTSTGWVLKGYMKGYVVIAESRFERGGDTWYGGLSYIPKGMVISIK